MPPTEKEQFYMEKIRHGGESRIFKAITQKLTDQNIRK